MLNGRPLPSKPEGNDIVGNPHSCIFDSQMTSVIGNMLKIVGWYDNETGYSSRILDLICNLSDKK